MTFILEHKAPYSPFIMLDNFNPQFCSKTDKF